MTLGTGSIYFQRCLECPAHVSIDFVITDVEVEMHRQLYSPDQRLKGGTIIRSAILLPDRRPLARCLSLTAARSALDRPGRERVAIPAPEMKTELRGVSEGDLVADPLSAVLWSHAIAGAITMFVAALDGGHGYAISPQAWADRVPGFLAWDTLITGRLVVARSLLSHGSLEVELDGSTLFVPSVEFNQVIKERPTGLGLLGSVVQALIESALASGERLTMEDLLEHVRRDGRIHGVASRQIKKVANELKPKEWSKPGRRKSL